MQKSNRRYPPASHFAIRKGLELILGRSLRFLNFIMDLWKYSNKCYLIRLGIYQIVLLHWRPRIHCRQYGMFGLKIAFLGYDGEKMPNKSFLFYSFLLHLFLFFLTYYLLFGFINAFYYLLTLFMMFLFLISIYYAFLLLRFYVTSFFSKNKKCRRLLVKLKWLTQ